MLTDNDRDEGCPIVRANVAREASLMTDEHASTLRHWPRVCRPRHRHLTAPASTCRGDVTPTPSKATFRSSSAACGASISSAPRSICTAIWPSSISAIATARRLAAMTPIAPTACCGHRRQAPHLSNGWCEGLMPKKKNQRDTRGAERAVQGRRRKANRRWRTKPHRRRRRAG